MTRTGMARHLGSCPTRRAAVELADRKKGKPVPLLHVQVQDAWSGEHWLQLEVDGKATLDDLDAYLRAIWLDCCGHMSRFSVGGRRGKDLPWGTTAERALPAGRELTHIYDFGTESVTLLKQVGSRMGRPTTKHPIVLMARNAPPDYRCTECGSPATHLCMECVTEEDEPGLLCAAHAASHPHEGYGEPMPLVNSPRMGMCGYDGPAEPPY